MEGRIRIDKWLWHARFFRTRARAQSAAAAGLIRLNGARVEKASVNVGTGDILTVPRGNQTLVVRIKDLALRRGSADDAKTLYEVVAETALDPPLPAP